MGRATRLGHRPENRVGRASCFGHRPRNRVGRASCFWRRPEPGQGRAPGSRPALSVVKGQRGHVRARDRHRAELPGLASHRPARHAAHGETKLSAITIATAESVPSPNHHLREILCLLLLCQRFVKRAKASQIVGEAVRP